MDHDATARATRSTLARTIPELAILHDADKGGARRELLPRRHTGWRPPRRRTPILPTPALAGGREASLTHFSSTAQVILITPAPQHRTRTPCHAPCMP